MDKILERKELFKLWIHRKSDNSNSRSEYVQKSIIGMSDIIVCN